MNVKQAKAIPIETLLEKHGQTPSRIVGGSIWFRSPFREEQTASFKVNTGRQLWYDFGIGAGGDILDLAMRLYSVNTVREALACLESTLGGAKPALVVPTTLPASSDTELELVDLGPLKSKRLREYLRERGIDPQVATLHVQEIHYRRGKREFLALAFANDSGGFELRSPSFKGTFRKKDITTIIRSAHNIMVFEGFIDYLSAISCIQGASDATILVLNSASMRDRAIEFLRTHPESTIGLFLDNDETGRRLADEIARELPGQTVIDRSSEYADHKDVNDWCRSKTSSPERDKLVDFVREAV